MSGLGFTHIFWWKMQVSRQQKGVIHCHYFGSLSTSLSHQQPIVVIRMDIWLDLFSFVRGRRRIYEFEHVDSSLSTKPPLKIVFFTASPHLLMSTLAQTCAECSRSNDIEHAVICTTFSAIPHLWVKQRMSGREIIAPPLLAGEVGWGSLNGYSGYWSATKKCATILLIRKLILCFTERAE